MREFFFSVIIFSLVVHLAKRRLFQQLVSIHVRMDSTRAHLLVLLLRRTAIANTTLLKSTQQQCVVLLAQFLLHRVLLVSLDTLDLLYVIFFLFINNSFSVLLALHV
jgi:hypothetical protein